MCTRTILDASLFSQFDDEKMAAWRRWINNGEGQLVYTLSGQFGQELMRNQSVYDYIVSERKAGAILVNDVKLANASKTIDEQKFKSNDKHVLKLAHASDALVLCTDDRDLQKDFNDLPRVHGDHRAVYPHGADRTARERFVNMRRCSRG